MARSITIGGSSSPGNAVAIGFVPSMRPGADDRLVGALALPEPATFLVITPEGTERKLGLGDVPVGRRGGKGQKVVKRGGVAALRRVES